MKKKERIDTRGSSMPHWAEQSRSANPYADQQRAAAARIAESSTDKKNGLRFLEEHNLPRYKKVSFSLSDFLDNPDLQISLLPKPATGKYYTSIVDDLTGKRVFKLDQARKQILPFVQSKLDSREISPDSTITLSEYWPNLYGGNIVIGEDGSITIELVEGKHARLAKGMGKQILSAKSNPFTGFLKFELLTDDDQLAQTLKKAVIDALHLIPKTQLVLVKNTSLGRFEELEKNELDQTISNTFTPGYYEFILSKKHERRKTSANLQAIFLDSRTGQEARKYFFK